MANVEGLYKDYLDLKKYLEKEEQPSLVVFVNNNFKKVLVIAAASFFEEEVKDVLKNFTIISSSNNDILVNFVKNKAIERMYHQYFQWDNGKNPRQNANNFFGLFGNDFMSMAINDVKIDPKLEQAIKDFLELGDIRNQFAHQDFAKIIPNKTAEEYYNLYKSSKYFIKYLKNKLEYETNLPNLFSLFEGTT